MYLPIARRTKISKKKNSLQELPNVTTKSIHLLTHGMGFYGKFEFW